MGIFRRIWPDVIAVLLFLLISFVYFITPVSEGLVLGGHDAVASVGQGREQVEYYERTGERSRWTNTLFSGMPTYQIAPSYPSTDVLHTVSRVYELGITGAVSYVFILLLGFYILLRAFQVRPWLAAAGAVLWAFSSYFFIIIAAGHIWKVLTLAFIPPTIAGIVLCYRGRYLAGGAVTALFAALQILSNHVQMSYYFLPLMFFMVLAYLADSIRQRTMGHWAKATGAVLIAGLLAVAANASNLYHTYEYSQRSLRGPGELTPTNPDNATTGGLARDYITQWSYGIDESLTFLIPDYKGGGSASLMEREGIQDMEEFETFYRYAATTQQALQESGQQMPPPGLSQYWGDQPFTVGPVYVGALVCFLFLFGLFFVRGCLKWALFAATLLSFLMGWGHNDAWFTNFCIDYLPMYNKFRTPSSALVVAEFTMPLLAVLALVRIIREPQAVLGTRAGKAGLVVGLLLTVGVCVALWMAPGLAGDCLSAQDQEMFAMLQQPFGAEYVAGYRASVSAIHHHILAASAGRSFGILLLGIASIGIYVFTNLHRKRGAGMALVAVLGLICLVDMWQVNRRYLNNDSFTDPIALQNPQPTPADEIILQDKTDYRVLSVAEGNPFNETSNHTAYFHQSIGGYNAAKLHRYQDLIDRCLQHEMSQFLGYINEAQGDMSQVPGDSLAPTLNMLNTKYIVFGKKAEQVVENPYANGNGWFVQNLQFVKGADAEIAALETLDTKHSAVADECFKEVLAGTPLDSGTVVLTHRDANEVTYSITSPKGGLAVLSEIYYPGWTATVDNQEVEIGRVNYVLRALKIPAGTHEVRLAYRPASLRLTERLAFVALGLMVLAVIVAFSLASFRKKLVSNETM